MPFEVPETWEWVKLCDITSVIGDGLHGTPQYDVKGDYFFINGNNLLSRQILIKDDTKKVSIEEYEKYKKPLNDTTILVSINGTIGNVGTFKDEKVILGKSACYFNIIPFLIKEYICTVIESQYFLKYALSSATGSTIKNVPLQAINDFFVPIPPIGEQKRIIEAIEQWLSIVGVLENEKNDLFKNIQQSKTKILDHAIHGKLVPQDPNDEPAIELLKRINPSFVPCDNAQYMYDLPNNWEWTNLGNIGNWQSGGTPDRKNKLYYNGEIPWLKIADLQDNYVTEATEFISEEGLNNSSAKINPTGSVALAMYGSIGKVGILTFPSTTNQAICVCSDYIVDQKYLFYYLISQRESFFMQSGGGVQANISKQIIVKQPIPTPPLNEQRRIVAKIEELFTILDEIQKSIEA